MRGFQNGLIYLSIISGSQDICILKFEKEVIFYEGFHNMKFQKMGTKSLISDFSKLPVK